MFNANDFVHGKAYPVAPGVQRITAPNAGMMTGPGTNTYLVGESKVAVIDTGVDNSAHLDAIEAAASGPIRWILITHAHPDHSPGAHALARRTGAKIYANPTALQGVRDPDFKPDVHLHEGDVIEAPDFRLRCLHTPGHAADHLCFLREADGLLFAGDHVMDSVTVVIAPPDGDMADYLDSLARLQQVPIQAIAPAHGGLITQASATFAQIISHRLKREQQILALLQQGQSQEPQKIANMVAYIYPEIPEGLRAVAGWQVYAHLLKLRGEGRVQGKNYDGTWCSL